MPFCSCAAFVVLHTGVYAAHVATPGLVSELWAVEHLAHILPAGGKKKITVMRALASLVASKSVRPRRLQPPAETDIDGSSLLAQAIFLLLLLVIVSSAAAPGGSECCRFDWTKSVLVAR
ncbi:hypothetical protein AK812_SmicGene56 [Symbiodinium microadriaticum]|uniref:Secreted protein n=1 Tax=Symbiodinium microadriaticum TaxID=2951 RepID=A0A1Q9F7M1_SYMMI|nr:hypothetical protein AK812_SmicGene56 [Symbiodinium microadriaticum]